jgi:hypothetical protein
MADISKDWSIYYGDIGVGRILRRHGTAKVMWRRVVVSILGHIRRTPFSELPTASIRRLAAVSDGCRAKKSCWHNHGGAFFVI